MVQSETESVTPAEIDIGSRLRRARQKLELDQRVVAEELQLLPQQVEALENNEFSYFKADIFVKGYLKSYAQLVELDEQEILNSFKNKYTRPEPTLHIAKKPLMTRRKLGKQKPHRWPIIVSITAVLCVVLFLWLAYQDKVESNNNSQSPIIVDPVETEIVEQLQDQNISGSLAEIFNQSADANNGAESLNVSVDDTVNNSTTTRESEEAQQTDSNAPNITGSQVNNLSNSLVIALSGNCWVKVTDKQGEVLATGTKRKGEIIVLNGQPPYRVVLGDADVATVTYRGKPVKLNKVIGKNSVRLTIGP